MITISIALLTGILLSIGMDIRSSGVTWDKFSPKVWWNKNGINTIVGLILAIVVTVFSQKMAGYEANAYTAFMSGFMSDVLVAKWDRRKRKLKEVNNDSESE